MFYDVLHVLFLFFIVFIGAFIGRKLFFANEHEQTASAIKHPTPAKIAPHTYSNPEQVFTKKNSWTGLALTVMFIISAGYLLQSNADLLTEKLSSPVSGKTQTQKKNQILLPGMIEGHTVVDGVNWIKIVATSTSGVPFEGWVSELAIHKEPPKENKMADAFMEKIGLPTNRERKESIKSLKNVSGALKEALKDTRGE